MVIVIDGPLPRHGSWISESVATEEDARDVARRLLTRGVDCLKAGRIADLVVVAADPLRSIAAIKQVDLVIRDGRVVWPR